MRDIEFYNPRVDVEPVVNNYVTQPTPIPRYIIVWQVLLTLLVVLEIIHAV